jgi:hypothetical protein
MKKYLNVVAIVTLVLCATTAYGGSAVVTNGKFTNIYVYPDPDKETWEQHMARLRPTDAKDFSRAAIDKFTADLMRPVWPSYFDALFQYNGINPPRFFGSGVASQSCVDAALKDEHDGVLQWDTIRSLSNCHVNGMDPSPQVNLIFSPDIKIGKIVPFGTSGEMCSQGTWAWHAWGVNTPNFTVLPTSTLCTSSFTKFTQSMSHEVVETISDPAGMGMGTFGIHELGDNCEGRADAFTTVNGFSLARYWSNFDNNCEPRLDPPSGSVAETWVLGMGSPLQRFTGSVHTLGLTVPADRGTSNARLTRAVIVIQTGGDDIRGGSNPGDNANVTLNFKNGSKTTVNVNGGRSWENGETHTVELALPSPAPSVSDITGVTIATNFGGGIGGDNWNVDKVALVVSFASGSVVKAPEPAIVHEWLNVSAAPLVRFTGNVHDYGALVPEHDSGKVVRALSLIISTGNDDLRGGSNPGDNCDVTIELASGKSIFLANVNRGQTWTNWTNSTINVPLPPEGLKGGEVKAVRLHTSFGGGIGGDNWNVNQIQLQATLADVDNTGKR